MTEISTTRRTRGQPSVIAHRVKRLLPEEIVHIAGIRTTAPGRTAIDLCGVLKSERAERAVEELLRKRKTSIPELRNYLKLEARQGRRGVVALRKIVLERDPTYVVTDSALEDDLEPLLLAANLPPPIRQCPVFDRGNLRRVFDFGYPRVLLGVEAQSYEHHDGRIPWSKDQSKWNGLASLGWQTLYYTRYDIDFRPHEITAEVEATYRQREHLFRAP